MCVIGRQNCAVHRVEPPHKCRPSSDAEAPWWPPCNSRSTLSERHRRVLSPLDWRDEQKKCVRREARSAPALVCEGHQSLQPQSAGTKVRSPRPATLPQLIEYAFAEFTTAFASVHLSPRRVTPLTPAPWRHWPGANVGAFSVWPQKRHPIALNFSHRRHKIALSAVKSRLQVHLALCLQPAMPSLRDSCVVQVAR